MSQQLPEEVFVRNERVNAAIAWVVTTLMLAVGVLSFLNGYLVTTALAAVAVFVAIVPSAVSGTWTRTVSWPLLLLASLPLFVTALGQSFLGGVVLGVSVATLAMLVVATLQQVTTVRMTPPFAVFFVFLTTLASAGFWAVGSAFSARYLGTTFLSTNTELMTAFTAATIAGLLAGGFFRLYFRRTLEGNVEGETAEVVA